MQNWLAAQAYARPEGLALIAGGEWLSYRALHQQVSRFAARLAALGVGRGTYVAVLLPNCLEAVLTLHAAAHLGCVLVLLNTRLTAREVDTLLDQAACDLLLCSRETAQTALNMRAPLRQRVCVHALDDPSFTILATVSPVEHQPASTRDPADPFVVLFTSGTTGTPKGVVLTYGNLFFSAMSSAYRIGVLPDDRWLCTLPLYHVGGLSIVMRSCLYGTAVELWQQFDAESIWAALTHEPITLVSLVPTMLARILDVGRHTRPPHALRLVLLGGAPADADLLARAQHSSIPVAATYGLTEAASQVATALPETTVHKPGSVGKPLLFTQVRVCDEQGQEQPSGQYGEIVVSGPTVMQGYLHHAPLPRDAGGVPWLATGDIGYVDEDGDMWVVQRRSDLIISGGENIYPAEIEAVLQQHPAVAEVAVVGIASAEWGQQVAAAIVRRDPALTVEDVRAFSKAHLAGYKQPRAIVFVDQLPRTASGKVQRSLLRDLFTPG